MKTEVNIDNFKNPKSMALSWIKEQGFTKVYLESDCLNVIDAIKNYKLDLSYTSPVITQCRGLDCIFSKF